MRIVPGTQQACCWRVGRDWRLSDAGPDPTSDTCDIAPHELYSCRTGAVAALVCHDDHGARGDGCHCGGGDCGCGPGHHITGTASVRGLTAVPLSDHIARSLERADAAKHCRSRGGAGRGRRAGDRDVDRRAGGRAAWPAGRRIRRSAGHPRARLAKGACPAPSIARAECSNSGSTPKASITRRCSPQISASYSSVLAGQRSALATATAQRMGLSPVAHIAGGFGAWKAAGGPLETPDSGSAP